ncbi:MAG TPA: helical backbone metal receptor [Bryobacteraceae bacterium]|nr:helical backbone metal receptor [Bryobacteraceae bacterium]
MVTRRFALWLIATGLLAAQPQRIVSTAPSITELLFALGLGDRVVGVTRFCRYPPEAQKKAIIGDYINPNIEVIASLKPDLVIVQQNPVRLTERLNSLRLHTLEIDQQNVPFEDAIYGSIRIVGNATGTSARAAQLIDTIRKGLESVRARSAALKRKRVMFVVGRSPGRLDGLIVVGRAAYLNEVMAIAGGENVFRDAVAPYPEISLESVIARDPEVLLDMGDMSDTVAVSEQHKREVVTLWQRQQVLTAVKQKRVIAIASDMYVVPGPRVVDAARALFTMIHPEAQ